MPLDQRKECTTLLLPPLGQRNLEEFGRMHGQFGQLKIATTAPGDRARPSTNHWVSYYQPSTNQWVYYGLGLRV